MKKTDLIDTMDFNVNDENNIRLYHGTTHVGVEAIPFYGFNPYGLHHSFWNCTTDEEVYFYEFEKFAIEEYIDDEEFDYIQSQILGRANESAQIQEATFNTPAQYTYVLEFVLPTEARQFIFDDDSCPVPPSGAVKMDTEIINYFITTRKCHINIYSFHFFPKMSYFILKGFIGNPYCEEYFSNLPPMEVKAIEMLSKNQHDSSELMEFFADISLLFYTLEDWVGKGLDPKRYQGE